MDKTLQTNVKTMQSRYVHSCVSGAITISVPTLIYVGNAKVKNLLIKYAHKAENGSERIAATPSSKLSDKCYRKMDFSVAAIDIKISNSVLLR